MLFTTQAWDAVAVFPRLGASPPVSCPLNRPDVQVRFGSRPRGYLPTHVGLIGVPTGILCRWDTSLLAQIAESRTYFRSHTLSCPVNLPELFAIVRFTLSFRHDNIRFDSALHSPVGRFSFQPNLPPVRLRSFTLLKHTAVGPQASRGFRQGVSVKRFL